MNHMTKYQEKILFTCLNSPYKNILWTAENRLYLFVEEGNEFFEYGVQQSLVMLSFVKNFFNNSTFQIAFLCSSFPCFPRSFVPKKRD